MNNTEKNILENQTHRIDWTIHSHTITSFLSDNSIRFVIHNSFLEKLTDLFFFFNLFFLPILYLTKSLQFYSFFFLQLISICLVWCPELLARSLASSCRSYLGVSMAATTFCGPSHLPYALQLGLCRRKFGNFTFQFNLTFFGEQCLVLTICHCFWSV